MNNDFFFSLSHLPKPRTASYTSHHLSYHFISTDLLTHKSWRKVFTPSYLNQSSWGKLSSEVSFLCVLIYNSSGKIVLKLLIFFMASLNQQSFGTCCVISQCFKQEASDCECRVCHVCQHVSAMKLHCHSSCENHPLITPGGGFGNTASWYV